MLKDYIGYKAEKVLKNLNKYNWKGQYLINNRDFQSLIRAGADYRLNNPAGNCYSHTAEYKNYEVFAISGCKLDFVGTDLIKKKKISF